SRNGQGRDRTHRALPSRVGHLCDDARVAALAFIVLIVALAAPGVIAWLALLALTRRARRGTRAPAVALHIATASLVVAGLLIATGILGTIHAVVRSRSIAGNREERMRALFEWVSHALGFGWSGLVLAIVGLIWVGFCMWRWRKPLASTRE